MDNQTIKPSDILMDVLSVYDTPAAYSPLRYICANLDGWRERKKIPLSAGTVSSLAKIREIIREDLSPYHTVQDKIMSPALAGGFETWDEAVCHTIRTFTNCPRGFSYMYMDFLRHYFKSIGE